MLYYALDSKGYPKGAFATELEAADAALWLGGPVVRRRSPLLDPWHPFPRDEIESAAASAPPGAI